MQENNYQHIEEEGEEITAQSSNILEIPQGAVKVLNDFI